MRERGHTSWRSLAAASLLALLGAAVSAAPMPATASCSSAYGDVNGDGKLDVSDVQCLVLSALNALAGQAPPTCTGLYGALSSQPDLNCDGQVGLGDIVLASNLVLGNPLAAEIDADGNGCADACDTPKAQFATMFAVGESASPSFTLRPRGTAMPTTGSSGSAQFTLIPNPN